MFKRYTNLYLYSNKPIRFIQTRLYSGSEYSQPKNSNNKSIKRRDRSKIESGLHYAQDFGGGKYSVTKDICMSTREKSPGEGKGSGTSQGSHIFTSKLEKQGYANYGGGFEHIDIEPNVEGEEPGWVSILSNPRIIRRHLDDYVIGQDGAKKVLSVAVFNHYSRVRANLKVQNVQRRSSDDFSNENKVKDNDSNIPPRVPLPVTNTASFQYHQLKRNWINPSSEGSSQSNKDTIHEEVDPLILSTIYEKSNVLLLGPTGSGKTLLARTLANVLKVPFSMSDATPFTQAGYVGEDVELVIQRLLQNCDFDVKKAEQGIVFIDEIDKIARRPDALSISKDVSGEGVQQALLRMLEGTQITITDKSGSSGKKSHSGSSTGGSPLNGVKGDSFTVDTSNILFILSGAFVGLEKIIMDRVSKASIGFDAPIRKSQDNTGLAEDLDESLNNYLDLVEPNDLVKYGLIPEFIGRLPVVANVLPLDEKALVRVLTEPKNCLVKQYQGLFKLNKIDLHFSNAALKAIAQLAITKQTGARGLRRIMEKVLLDTMYEAPGTSVSQVLVTHGSVMGRQKPYYLAKGQEDELDSLLREEELLLEALAGVKPVVENNRKLALV